MTIRKKIKLSNVMMALIPIMLTAIIAVHTGETDQGVISYLQNYILNYILGFIVAFLVLTVCVNGILSYWISKSVLVPLQKLSLGTKEIKDGNLDTGIAYTKPDEFGQVCKDFDEMWAYLKESVEQRLKDEQRKKDLIIGISHPDDECNRKNHKNN